MYCENCGHKLENNYLFCSECGTKVSNLFVSSNKISNNTLWIVLGCIFGVIVLIPFVIFLLSFFVIGNNINTVEEKETYDINEYYDYENMSNNYIYRNDSVEVIEID